MTVAYPNQAVESSLSTKVEQPNNEENDGSSTGQISKIDTDLPIKNLPSDILLTTSEYHSKYIETHLSIKDQSEEIVLTALDNDESFAMVRINVLIPLVATKSWLQLRFPRYEFRCHITCRKRAQYCKRSQKNSRILF
jgi:hypothetical protein